MSLMDAVRSANAAETKSLLKQDGLDPNFLDEETGDTALGTAASLGHLAIVRALLDAGADPNFKRAASLPLVEAAGKGHAEVVRALLGSGAKIDARDEGGVTALIAAAAGGHSRAVALLLKAGASAKRRDRKGSTAILAATDRKQWDVVDQLLPLASQAEKHQVAARRTPAAQGVSKQGADAMYKAAENNDVPALRRLLGRGVPVDAVGTSSMTALMRAANMDRMEAVKFLLEHGADPSLKCGFGETALTYAAAGGSMAAVEHLYPLASPKDRKRAMKQVAFLQMLPSQYPAWQGWTPPEVPTRAAKKS